MTLSLQDAATNMGLGDVTASGQRAKRMSELESELTLGKEETELASKASQSRLASEYGPALFSQKYEEFKPSQESMGDFIALGTLLATSGAMLGMKGKSAGLMAMNSIAGMMKGYQQGRKDIYEQERQKFEENMKVRERNRQEIKEAFDMAMKMAPTNYKGAVDFLNKTLTSLGVTLPKAMVDRSGLTHTAGVVQTAYENENKLLSGISSRRAAKQELAQLKAEQAGKTAEMTALDKQLKIRDLLKKVETDPKARAELVSLYKTEYDKAATEYRTLLTVKVNPDDKDVLAAQKRMKEAQSNLERIVLGEKSQPAAAPKEHSENWKAAKKAIDEGKDRDVIIKRMQEQNEDIEGL